MFYLRVVKCIYCMYHVTTDELDRWTGFRSGLMAGRDGSGTSIYSRTVDGGEPHSFAAATTANFHHRKEKVESIQLMRI